MSAIYVGVDNVARKMKKGYVGVDGVARKIKKIYVGVDGIARLAWQDTVMPKVGDLLTMNLEGSNKLYRVIHMQGTVAKVITMHDVNAGMEFTNTGNTKYSGSYVNAFLRDYYYANLTDEAKAALVLTSFFQQKWDNNYNGNPVYTALGGESTSNQYSYGYSFYGSNNDSFLNTYTYAPSIRDFVDYFSVIQQTDEPVITNLNLWGMLWNTFSNPGDVNFWLTDAANSYDAGVYYIDERYGRFSITDVTSGAYQETYPIRACFQIDLSKIDFTIN